MTKDDLINAIKQTPSSGDIYYNSQSFKQVYYNNSLIWAKKNTAVIYWDDAMTMTIDVGYDRDKCAGNSKSGYDGPSYYGNRNSNSCSVNGSGWAERGALDYVAGRCWSEITITGKIFKGARAIPINSSSSRSGADNDSFLNPEYAYIYNSDGAVVANLGNGTTNISSYSDGTYYFKIFRGTSSYGAYEDGSSSCNCSVSITP